MNRQSERIWGKKEEAGGARGATKRVQYRARELSELRAALEESIAGRGGCILISGEPGIGKTRLADELNHAGARGVRVVWGRCWQEDGAPAYWPWLQVLRACLESIDPEQRRAILESGSRALTSVRIYADNSRNFRARCWSQEDRRQRLKLDPALARFRMFGSVATLLTQLARSRATLFEITSTICTDADQPSLMMLWPWSRQLAETRILIVGTHREVEVKAIAGAQQAHRRSEPRCPLDHACGFSAKSRLPSWSSVVWDTNGGLKLRFQGFMLQPDGNPLFVDGIGAMLDRSYGRWQASASSRRPRRHFLINALQITSACSGARASTLDGRVRRSEPAV